MPAAGRDSRAAEAHRYALSSVMRSKRVPIQEWESKWLVGLLSSLGATFLVIVGQWLLRDRLIPLWRARVLKAPNIDQTRWHGFSPDGPEPEKPNSVLSIKQTGTRIRATADRTVKEGKRTFSYEGWMYSGQLVLTWEEPEGAGFIVGSMVLVLSSDLQELEGNSTYYHHRRKKVVSSRRLYRRL